MTQATTRGVADARPPRLGGAVVPLLAVAVFINYVDRGNLATAAPLIRDQLHLSNTTVGMLLSAFFLTYAPGQLLAAWVAERINPYRTLALGVVVWSVATALTGLAAGFGTLLALRLALGLGESAAFPCASALLARHLPPERLGAPNGAIAVSLALGPAFGTFAGGMLIARLGWRPVFVLFGLISLLWLIPWARASRAAARSGAAPPEAPSLLAILRRRSAWGTCLGQFCGNYIFYFVISWLPTYLVKARGFSLSEMAALGGALYLLNAVAGQAAGVVSDRWMARGASSTRVRKTALVASHLGVALCMLVCATLGPLAAIIALFGAGICFGINMATIYTVPQTLGGPAGGGKWAALQNAVANLAGIVAPWLTGAIVDRTGGFEAAFALAAAISLLGVFFWWVVVGRIVPVAWPLDSKRRIAPAGSAAP